jgi:hypothetical protein
MLPIGTYLKMRWTELNSKHNEEVGDRARKRRFFMLQASIGTVFVSYGIFVFVCQFLN